MTVTMTASGRRRVALLDGFCKGRSAKDRLARNALLKQIRIESSDPPCFTPSNSKNAIANQESHLGTERNLIVTATATKTDGTKNLTNDASPQLNKPDTTTQTSESLPLGKLQDKLAKDLVRIFKLLSDETRLRILYSLSQAEELHVRALCELLQLSQPAVSHHLGMLRNAGIVDPRRDGKHNYYRILPGNFEHLLMLVFDGIPEDEHAVRFGDLDLGRHRPIQPR